MKLNIIKRLIGVAIFCFLPGFVLANMSVYPMELGIGETGAAQIRVISQSDGVQFVKVTEKQILNPGTQQEQEADVEQFGQSSLVITPQKLAISAGSQRLVRLVALELPEKETTWRVYFEGVPELEDNVAAASPQKTTTKVGINLVWGALVHVAPKKAVASLTLDAQRGQVINDGTLRIPLREVGVCDQSGVCDWKKETTTIYPGTELKIASLMVKPGKTYKARYFNWLKKRVEEIDLSVKR